MGAALSPLARSSAARGRTASSSVRSWRSLAASSYRPCLTRGRRAGRAHRPSTYDVPAPTAGSPPSELPRLRASGRRPAAVVGVTVGAHGRQPPPLGDLFTDPDPLLRAAYVVGVLADRAPSASPLRNAARASAISSVVILRPPLHPRRVAAPCTTRETTSQQPPGQPQPPLPADYSGRDGQCRVTDRVSSESTLHPPAGAHSWS